jgi:hypothetical protein
MVKQNKSFTNRHTGLDAKHGDYDLFIAALVVTSKG